MNLNEQQQAIVRQALDIMEQAVHYGPIFESPNQLKTFLRLKYGAEENEQFSVVFLDAQHRLIAVEQLFRGSLTQTSVYPRVVVKRSLVLNAAAVVLCHNHPSGNTQPSRADEYLTQTLKTALHLVDVRVLDHLVVTANEHHHQTAFVLKALADPARIQLISILMAARPGEVSTGDLAEAVGLSSATVSHHLGQLKKAGLVSSERRGINVLYRAEPDALEALRAVLATCC